MKYLTTIGLEVHVQLKTRSKMFCGCAVEFGAGANVHTCPTCLGLPGALPVMNEHALELTTLTGLMLGCKIAPQSASSTGRTTSTRTCPRTIRFRSTTCRCAWAGPCRCTIWRTPRTRRNPSPTPDKKVGLVRIHLEEDVAKSFHYDTSTGIDFNRAGTPLMEIVTQPEIDSPEEAFAFLSSLRQILLYGGVSDADMEKGQMRCDCNVSVRPEGQAGIRREDRDQKHEQRQRRAQSVGLRDRPPDRRTGSRAARSSRKPGAGTTPAGRRSSCGPRRTRTTTVISPIPI